MRVYYFTNAKFGLAAIRDQRLKIARIHQLNDPFEFLGVDLSDRSFRIVVSQTKSELSKTKGILCFSKSWRHPMLWAHYADGHRGICLGFDANASKLQQVNYVNSRCPKPDVLDESFMKKLLCTKFVHWSYEDEYRFFTTLTDAEHGLYFFDFSAELE